MAHYAKINDDNVVERVEVLDDFYEWSDTGELDENRAVATLKKFFGDNTTWKKTSYNNNVRGKFAGVGDVYDPSLDKFIASKPAGMESWVLNTETLQWEPPTPMPPSDETRTWQWNETTKTWEEELQCRISMNGSLLM